MAESYVRPVGHPGAAALEPRSAWVAIWRFRLVMIFLVLGVAAGGILVVQYFSGNFAGSQDPSISVPASVPSPAGH